MIHFPSFVVVIFPRSLMRDTSCLFDKSNFLLSPFRPVTFFFGRRHIAPLLSCPLLGTPPFSLTNGFPCVATRLFFPWAAKAVLFFASRFSLIEAAPFFLSVPSHSSGGRPSAAKRSLFFLPRLRSFSANVLIFLCSSFLRNTVLFLPFGPLPPLLVSFHRRASLVPFFFALDGRVFFLLQGGHSLFRSRRTAVPLS